MKKYILYFILICIAIGLIKEYIVPLLLLLCLATIVFSVFYFRRKKLEPKENPPLIETNIPDTHSQERIPSTTKRRGYQHIDIHSIKPINPNATPDTPFTGKNVVFSGYFSLPIDEMMQAAVDAGAILKSRVTKSTNYLILGKQNAEFLDENGMSSKQRTATKLMEQGEAEIIIINEAEFLDMAQYSDTLPF